MGVKESPGDSCSDAQASIPNTQLTPCLLGPHLSAVLSLRMEFFPCLIGPDAESHIEEKATDRREIKNMNTKWLHGDMGKGKKSPTPCHTLG